MPEPNVELGIVIPVWSGRFLGEALDSLRAQTDLRFRVYLGDDASPDDIAAIVRERGTGLSLVHHRFATNLGGRDLVRHWNRCIALAGRETWIWLFADDDEAEPDSVAAFYRERERRPGARLFCLAIDEIDETGKSLGRYVSPPVEEGAEAFLEELLLRRGREVRGADHLFARSLFDDCGGFVWTPQALYADLATWVAFTEAAGQKYRLTGGGLRWRNHRASVSRGNWPGSRRAFLDGLMIFTSWVDQFIGSRPPEWRERMAHQMFAIYCYTYRQLPEAAARGEGWVLLRHLWGLRHVGGKRRALWLWQQWLRVQMRGWPVVSSWCRWRARRS